MPDLDRRERLIDTAIQLFSESGFHATGIDHILAESGVAKKTLYRYFRSKDELILAALKKFDGLFRNRFMARVEAKAETSYDRLLAVFDVAGAWFEENNFLGCIFINAVGEYSRNDTPIRAVTSEFKIMMYRYIRGLCADAGAREADALAEQLALLLEGAIVTAQVSRRSRAAQVAKTIAEALIADALPPRDGHAALEPA